jgi:epsilon-lactone hydrolase
MMESAKQELSSTIADDGSVRIPAFTLPFSKLASPGAAEYFVWKHRLMKQLATAKTLESYVEGWDKYYYAPLIEKQNLRYQVDIQPKTIDGVYTEIFTPAGGIPEKNRDRILINLHGGGFGMGARNGGQVESIPVAAVSAMKIISIDYRQGPHHHFPAASEDIAAVYRELLKAYKPENIGMYGSSAGAFLTAAAMAWFQKEDIPLPGAIALSGAAAGSACGDSLFTAGYATDLAYGTPNRDQKIIDTGPAYFVGADATDPLVAPVISPKILSKFPPTLLITGTRSVDLSFVVHDHNQLINAGVEAELRVWEAMDHCFLYEPDLQESREAYLAIAEFFDKRLGK